MTRIRYYWLNFLRLWHVIDLLGAKQSGNWPMVSDCRMRIAEIDQQLDKLEIQQLRSTPCQK